MKAILMSIRPEWVAKILNGDKTVEIRKTAPKCDLPIDVYIYCTKGDGSKRFNLLKDKCNEYHLGWEYTSEGNENVNDIIDGPYNGKIVAKFVCRKAEEMIVGEDCCGDAIIEEGYDLIDQTCLTEIEIIKYLGGRYKSGCAIHISDLVIFDKPKELSEFIKCDNKHIRIGNCFIGFGGIPRLTRAPQSWCYVEVEE